MEREIKISFDRRPAHYRPGEQLAGHVDFYLAEPLPVERVELSVLWHTMGKGTENSAVILFETALADQTLTMSSRLPFQTQLPALPLSYDGQLINIHWLVRVRVYPQRGREFGAEARFQLALTAETSEAEADIWQT